MRRAASIYVYSSALILFCSASVKLASAFGVAHILAKQDAVFHLSFRIIFITIGLLELAIAALCMFGNNLKSKICILVWLATSFLFYHVAVRILNAHYCPCLGGVTDALHISEHIANILTIAMLSYLLFGGYVILFSLFGTQPVIKLKRNFAMKIILTYLLVGGYGTLFRLWWQKGKAEGRMQNEEVKLEGRSETGSGR